MSDDNVTELFTRDEREHAHQTCEQCGDPWIIAAIVVDWSGRVASRTTEGKCASCGAERLIATDGGVCK